MICTFYKVVRVCDWVTAVAGGCPVGVEPTASPCILQHFHSTSWVCRLPGPAPHLGRRKPDTYLRVAPFTGRLARALSREERAEGTVMVMCRVALWTGRG